MKLPHRRRFLHLAASAVALPAVSRIASADAYPSRPVHIIVGYAAGGATDISARLMGQWLTERLGQQFVIDNRSGASSNVGTELVVRASPDGYTVLQVGLTNAINATLFDNLNFDFIRDIAPVASTMRTINVMEVKPTFPAKTVQEFITYAKANPGKINMATTGAGSPPHLNGELFNAMAGVNLVPVSYRSSAPALTDLLGGSVQVMFDNILSSIAHIKAGNLRALAVTSAKRSDVLPGIPTVGEFVPGYEASGWFGLGAPKNTPAEIIDTLNREINAGLADPTMQARLAELGGTVLPGSPAEFGKLIAQDTEKWGKVIRAANIKPD